MGSRGTAVDLFSGVGGASLGLENADFDVRAAAELDDTAREYYEKNLGLEPMPADLSETSFEEILDHFDLDSDEIDVVVGCPPCQNFSALRDTDPWDEDEPKDELLQAYLDLIEEAKAPVVIFENVPGILTSDGGQYVEYLRSRMAEIGYGFKLDVLNAADFGVPQRRKRTIGFGVLGADEEDVQLPEPTHAHRDEAEEKGLEQWETVEDWIHPDEGLARLKRGEKDSDDEAHRARRHHDSTMDIIRAVPEDGGSRTEIEDDDLVLDCHKNLQNGASAGNVYGRMAWKKPAPTLTTRCTSPSCGRFLHPEQDRAITFREAARLMTFPDDFELPNKNGNAEQLIGNAVPPKFMEELTKELSEIN